MAARVASLSPAGPVDVLQRVRASFDALTPQLRRAARWLVDHPTDVALLSMREQARGAEVSPPTMLRLARALGFPDFASLRLAFQADVAAGRVRFKGPGRYGGRASALQSSRAGAKVGQLTGEIVRAQIGDVGSVELLNSSAQIEAVVKAIADARRVGFLGVRASFAIAFYFRYGYNLIATNGVLFEGLGGFLADQVEVLDEGDVLVAVSQAPYSAPAVAAIKAAIARGTKVVALTDSELSPLARLASHTLLSSAESLSFFPSMVAPLALVEVLLAALAARGGKKVLRRLADVDARLLASRAYWTEPRPASPPAGRASSKEARRP
jgi:DNA-binding MurR/RpiR family transcriptional regulator